MRVAAALVFGVFLLAPAPAAGERTWATWYEKSGYYFRVSYEGRETDNDTAWACGGTQVLQNRYIVLFRSWARGHCGAQTVKSISWHEGQVVSAVLPCEGLELAWKQFRGPGNESPSEFIYSNAGRPTGRQIAEYFDTACRGKRIESTQGKP